MKRLLFIVFASALLIGANRSFDIPACYKHVDQVLWVVSDLDNTIQNYEKLGFSQIRNLGQVDMVSGSAGTTEKIKLACANLGGAHVNWIQPSGGSSVFQDFLGINGDGAMSLVHRFSEKEAMKNEIQRLGELGIKVLDKITLKTEEGDLNFVLMDTQEGGKFALGFTTGDSGLQIHEALNAGNRNHMKLNQYAFAIRDPEPVSEFWNKLGQPAFQINHPVLGETHYYGEIVDHQLIQGWQRHGTIAYEWCIPVKPPIVYDDHIRKHGEGIHHLAFSVEDMDKVLEDFTSRGFVVSMGGTWGEKGKPGSGRYEYIDLDEAGGLTMELLWNYRE